MLRSNLDISYRVQLFNSGLLYQEADIRDLISDALATNMMHYLPKKLVNIGRELIEQKIIEYPES